MSTSATRRAMCVLTNAEPNADDEPGTSVAASTKTANSDATTMSTVNWGA
jgi:hypothetical protein